uniref:restriction endonuclease subunit S n=1 Tax=Seonamhaeicola sp. TaxID=1912245 RepID=UPI00356AE958
MNKEKQLVIPKLRFPQFMIEGEWSYVNGNKLFKPISNKNHNSDLPILAITQDQGAIPRELIDYHVSVSKKSIEGYKVIEVGDFIISLRSFQGGIEYSNYLGLCSPAYIILRKTQDIVDDFYRQYFKSFIYIQDLNVNLEGIRDGKMISYKQFSEILIPKPKKEEQQKIANCLSSLDNLITAETEKLDLLKDHKKGLLQNLFPAEGETQPHYRFPEFKNDGDWEEK